MSKKHNHKFIWTDDAIDAVKSLWNMMPAREIRGIIWLMCIQHAYNNGETVQIPSRDSIIWKVFELGLIDEEVHKSLITENRRKPVPKRNRDFVLDRDGGQCLVCGRTDRLNVDHIHPAFYGGSNATSNLQTLCTGCHKIKGLSSIDCRDIKEWKVWNGAVVANSNIEISPHEVAISLIERYHGVSFRGQLPEMFNQSGIEFTKVSEMKFKEE